MTPDGQARLDLPAHISERVRDAIARGGGLGIDEEARGHGAIALMGTIGSIWMLRPDGTLWDADADFGKPLTPLPETARIKALVWGVERFPWLAELLPARPSDAASCSDCSGSGRLGNSSLLCQTCEGLGWTTSNSPSQDQPSLKMKRSKVGVTIWVLSALLAVAWFVEAFTVGRGFVSRYLAPVAIAGNLLGVFLMRKRRAGGADE
jgi:hypothetical protein